MLIKAALLSDLLSCFMGYEYVYEGVPTQVGGGQRSKPNVFINHCLPYPLRHTLSQNLDLMVLAKLAGQ